MCAKELTVQAKEKRFRAGAYGAITIWCVKNIEGTFITFKGLRIAKQAPDRQGWIVLLPQWTVTPLGKELWVQHEGADGVFISLHGGWFK
jgi:hypothetical protein